MSDYAGKYFSVDMGHGNRVAEARTKTLWAREDQSYLEPAQTNDNDNDTSTAVSTMRRPAKSLDQLRREAVLTLRARVLEQLAEIDAWIERSAKGGTP